MEQATTPVRDAIVRARRCLDELLRAVRVPDRHSLAACFHEHARLRTHGGDVVVGRVSIIQWFAVHEAFLRSLEVRPERLEVRPDGVVLDWWGTTDGGGLDGRVELVVDADGRVTELRVVVRATDRAHRGVRVEVEPPVGRLVLDRVDKRNAVSQPMLATMTQAVRAFAARDDVRAVVLRGEGPAFCAGEDVGGFDFPDDQAARDFLDGPLSFFEELESMPRPVFVAAHGAALGFGSEVLLVVDGVASAPGTQFGFAEIDHGAVPSVLVSRGLGVVRRRHVADLALTGRRVGPEEGVRMGLVHKITDDPVGQVEAWADEVSGFSPDAAATIEHLVGADVVADHTRARDFMPRVLTQVKVNLP